jgi:hypothetical protein
VSALAERFGRGVTKLMRRPVLGGQGAYLQAYAQYAPANSFDQYHLTSII